MNGGDVTNTLMLAYIFGALIAIAILLLVIAGKNTKK